MVSVTRNESSSVYNFTDMLKILHGFIDLIDSSASMDSTKSSPVYNFINKQNYARVIDLLHGAKKCLNQSPYKIPVEPCTVIFNCLCWSMVFKGFDISRHFR